MVLFNDAFIATSFTGDNVAEVIAGILPAISSAIPWIGAVLAGIGLWNVLNTIFGGGTAQPTVQTVATPAYVDPFSQMINALMSMQLMSTLMSQLTNLFKANSGGIGIDIGSIVGLIVPIIAVILIVKLLGGLGKGGS